jgi:hypothetical protein
MATINYTSEVNLGSGYVKVEWAGMSPGDEGQPFDCAGLRLASQHYWGDFGNPSDRGQIVLMASNELSPAHFALFQYSQFEKYEPLSDGAFLNFVGIIKPVADSKLVSGGVALLFVPRD